MDVMAETRHELFNYHDIIEIPEVKNDSKDRMPHDPGNQGATPRLLLERLAKNSKPSNAGKTTDIKYVGCFKCHKKGHYAKKCPDAKAKDEKGYFKVRQLKDRSAEKNEEKSIRQIRIRHSDLNSGYHDPFLRYWIKIYDLLGPARDPTHPGYLAPVFVDTGANCNTISRALFEQRIDRG